MSRIYGNSTLTIAALWGPDSRSGCFIERDPLSALPCRIAGHPSNALYAEPHRTTRGYTLYQFSARGSGGQVWLPGALTTRAWVIRERLLSPRLLYYGPDELHWDSRDVERSETWPTSAAWPYPSKNTVGPAYGSGVLQMKKLVYGRESKIRLVLDLTSEAAASFYEA